MLSLIFHFGYKVGWCRLQVLSWTWNLEQRLLFRCDSSPSNCLVGRKKAFSEKFGDKSRCCVRESARLVIPTLWLQLLVPELNFHAFSVRTFKRENTLAENLCTLWSFITSSTPIPCQFGRLFLSNVYYWNKQYGRWKAKTLEARSFE